MIEKIAQLALVPTVNNIDSRISTDSSVRALGRYFALTLADTSGHSFYYIAEEEVGASVVISYGLSFMLCKIARK